MNSGIDVARRTFVIEDDELVVSGARVTDLAREYGTPLFVYDAPGIRCRLASLRDVLPDRFEVYYSIKANPSREILKIFVEQGCGLEIASGGEFHQAVAAGCNPGRILFAGPGKTPEELRYVLQAGIAEIHAESESEIAALAELCEELDTGVDVAVRINPEGQAQGGAMRMGGKASPFGIDEERMDGAIRSVVENPRLRFSGVHLFIGTQILDPGVFERQYRHGLRIASHAAEISGGALDVVDFGGGLGIPYYANEHAMDVGEYGAAVHAAMAAEGNSPAFEGTRFVIEPGRFLVGEFGVYVTRVTTVKRSRERTYGIVDGGMHHHLAASGNLGQVIKRNYPVALLERMSAAADHRIEIVGPLCTPLDVLARETDMPEPREGELFGVFQSGAYGRTSSPHGFLSHPSPPEVLVDDDGARLIRRRATYDDFLSDQV